MIRVNEDWIIEVEPLCYTLKKDLHKTVKAKNGKTMVPAYKTIGYFSSPDKALNRLGEGNYQGQAQQAHERLRRGCRGHQRST